MLMMLIPESWMSMQTQWYIMFALATPVQFWAGGQFYRGAWAAARHHTTDMNTLIAVGTSVAYLYSTAVTFFPTAFEQAAGAGFEAAVYYDSAVIIIGLILLGRWLEARAKGQTSAAMRRLVGLQAKTARVVRPAPAAPVAAGAPEAEQVRLRAGRVRSADPPTPPPARWPPGRCLRSAGATMEIDIPVEEVFVGDRSSCGRARRSPWTAWSSRGAPPWTSPCSPASPSRWRRARATRS